MFSFHIISMIYREMIQKEGEKKPWLDSKFWEKNSSSLISRSARFNFVGLVAFEVAPWKSAPSCEGAFWGHRRSNSGVRGTKQLRLPLEPRWIVMCELLVERSCNRRFQGRSRRLLKNIQLEFQTFLWRSANVNIYDLISIATLVH